MRPRHLASVGVRATVIAVVSLAPVATAGQPQTATSNTWTPPRTPWGEPDLQGIWDYRTLTPVQRPRELAGKEFFTEEEAAELEQRIPQPGERDLFAWLPTPLTKDRRTSLIVDPPDGRIPPLTAKAEERVDAMRAANLRSPHGPEDLTLLERCILGRTSGPPMLPSRFHYDARVQVFQTPGNVVLLNEVIHEVRIIPVDGRPPLPSTIRQWRGDSRGRWEGHTLVVETTNFSDKTNYGGLGFANPANPTPLLGANMHVIERFTRVDADTITYEFTVDDPTTFTRPWSGALPMKKTEGPLFEFACHEGNERIMLRMLMAARLEERPTIDFHGVDVADAGALVPLEAEVSTHGVARVERVEFVVDGIVVGVDREVPYEVTWTASGPGRHVVTATVHDSEGNAKLAVPRIVFVGTPALERYIAEPSDDMEEGPDGLMDLSSSDLELVRESGGEQIVAIRFNDIRISRSAEIREAYLQFTVDEASTEQTDLMIHVESVGDAAPLTEVRRTLSSRRRSSASLQWLPEAWDVVGESSLAQRTPNLSGLIEELVNRPDWHEGNAVVFLITGSGKRVAKSYEGGGPERAPRLYIETR